MDKVEVLLDLLKNKEFDKITQQDVNILSTKAGKRLYIIKDVYFVWEDDEQQHHNVSKLSAEDLLRVDLNCKSTLYLTEDKHLPLDIVDSFPEPLSSSQRWELSTIYADDGSSEVSLDYQQDADGYYAIGIAGPGGMSISGKLINIWVILHSVSQEL